MNTTTLSADQTMSLAEKVGARLRGGECIELISDVGGGKTTFVRGLARGAGSLNHVASPTFTISKVYNAPNFKIVHFDFYRLPEAGLIEHEIEEAVQDGNDVVVVEWSNIVQQVLPDQRLQVEIVTAAENSRQITFTCPAELEYLIQEIE